MAYATIEDLQARSKKEIPKSEYKMYNALLEDASVLIDAVNFFAKEEAKKEGDTRTNNTSIQGARESGRNKEGTNDTRNGQ